MRIDAHHHFWKYNPAEYGWIEDPAIARDYLPADLDAAMKSAGVAGAISVQARETLEETHWLLDLAEEHAFIRGVVGWAPLVSPDIRAILADLAGRPKLRGVRHVLQSEPANDLMEDGAFNEGVAALVEFDLRYDLLIFARHLPQATRFVDRHPHQRFILDHIAKPAINRAELQPWADDLRELSLRENVCCKLSGMVTEADLANWKPDDLRPFFDTVMEAFGPGRLMFGSDWPVCLMATTYRRWVETVEKWTCSLTANEQNQFWSQTATETYGL